jgi:DNA invertase Pin-like site-specific DNA recombinase
MDRVVAYLRVSTQRQQRSGLGIEAQRAAIERFAAAEGLAIVSEYVEAETGKGADALDRRPQLAAALAAARAAKCFVLVSKLDRLSRDVAFVAGSWLNGCRSSWPSLVGMPIHSCYICLQRWPRRSVD